MKNLTLIARAAVRAATAGPQPAQGSMDYELGLLEPPGTQPSFVWRDTSFPSPNIDLVPTVDAVENQGGVNECTGEAASSCVEVGLRRAGLTVAELSAMFPYMNSLLATAAALHTDPADVGTSLFAVLNLARTNGFATEALCPSTAFTTSPPSDAAYADALARLVWRFERLGRDTMTYTRDMRADWIAAMRAGIPVMFCVPIAASFFSISGPLDTHPSQWERTYIGAANSIGNHAMLGVGLGMWGGVECVLAQNSYGPEWGDGGFVAIPMSAITGSAFDVFAIRTLAGVSFGEIPLSAYRWVRDTTLADGRRVTIDVDGVPGQVYRLYQAAFCRTPDASGMGYWIDVARSGVAMHDIANTFVTSPEFGQLYGTSLSNLDYVRQLYRNVLHREGDDGGVAFWTGNLDSGAIDRAGVLIEFAQSPENRAATDPVIALGVIYAAA